MDEAPPPRIDCAALIEAAQFKLRGTSARAMLAAVDDPDTVFPLQDGHNLVGRRWNQTRRIMLEGAQWRFQIDGTIRRALVADPATTGLSVIVPATAFEREATACSSALDFRSRLCRVESGYWLDRADQRIEGRRGATWIPHPNYSAHDNWLPVHEGDVFVGMYAAFVFGWVNRGQ
jgi:hypothetical protein